MPLPTKADLERKRWQDDFFRRVDDLCRRTEYLVEANDFAMHELWSTWHDHRGMPWEQVSAGSNTQVGELDGMPVCVNVSFAIVEHFVIAFWDMTSMVTDLRLVEPWLKKTFPRVADRSAVRGSRTANAMNFHNIVLDIEARTRPLVKHDKDMYVPCPQCGRKGV